VSVSSPEKHTQREFCPGGKGKPALAPIRPSGARSRSEPVSPSRRTTFLAGVFFG
jgi:hypothetical protein